MKSSATDGKYVFSFREGDGKNRILLGGKGANLCEMTRIGLNVPPGFVISTVACRSYLARKDGSLPPGLMDEVKTHIREVESRTAREFGSAKNPLLVSVRSGSAVSMPGMMDTTLNLGLNTETLQGLIRQTGNPRFAYDSYRRFIQLFGKVALGVEDSKFDAQLEAVKTRAGVRSDVDLRQEDLKEVAERFLTVIEKETGNPLPMNVYDQLEAATKAVFNSWMGRRAVDYRREFGITPDIADGTAVNVQAMVFGNMGNDSATGVAFTRDPGTGENVFFGEYLTNAQGEDVVAGIRTPKPIADMAAEMPDLHRQLEELRSRLESHYREVQDFEFTIEKGILYCLQTRNGKMNAAAMVRTSVEMTAQGILSREEALLRIKPSMLEQLLHPRLDASHKAPVLAQGLPASPGAAGGLIVFDADRAANLGKAGEKVILVREETKPEDIHGFFASRGILTSRGGKTSHAAVVARSMGKPCVSGAEGITVDVHLRTAVIGDKILREGDYITIDGGTGHVYEGVIPTVDPVFSAELKTLLQWADEAARLKVYANADTPDTALKALEYGAMGIGLCRTERMFNALERLPIVLDMILAETVTARQNALNKLLPIQKGDFKEIFTTMAGKPVTVRLLDPPIHEFLPTPDELREELRQLEHLKTTAQGVGRLYASFRLLHADALLGEQPHLPFDDRGVELIDQAIIKKELMLKKVRELQEVNPMLGHRGVRLGLTYPEIYKMQIRAILETAAECRKEGLDVRPEIMVPQVCTAQELKQVKKYLEEVLEGVEAAYGFRPDFKFGTMIEVVRACMRAGELAREAQFFSFGTNDLTQAVFSFSREDAENKFLPLYAEKNILQENPFEGIDRRGVGRLMRIAVEWGRETKPDLEIGICGEQGGHPESIIFCHKLGLDYVSCSGPRVPVARLAAAHAALEEKKGD